jgi:microcystin degradation protein MlrC
MFAPVNNDFCGHVVGSMKPMAEMTVKDMDELTTLYQHFDMDERATQVRAVMFEVFSVKKPVRKTAKIHVRLPFLKHRQC